MGIQTVNTEPKSLLRHQGSTAIVMKPGNNADALLSVTDPTAPSVGDELMTNRPIPVFGHGVALTYTDSAGSDATCSVLVTGVNHLGEAVSETISHTAGGAAVTQSIHAYSRVNSVTLTAIGSAAAADQLDVGYRGEIANGCRIGIPAKVGSLGEIVGPYLVQLVATSLGGDTVSSNLLCENFDADTMTFDVANTLSNGVICAIMFDAVVGIDTR